jgi:serine/threonine protein kinase
LKSLSEDAPVRAKVGDFGLSRAVAHEIVGALQSWQWHAPEVISCSIGEAYDESADIYSFGIVCWEIATRKYPFEEFADESRFASSDLNIKRAVIEEDLRPSPPPDTECCPAEFVQLITSCWQRNPKNRPRFPKIVALLERMTEYKSTATNNATLAANRDLPVVSIVQPGSKPSQTVDVNSIVFATRVEQVGCKQLGISSSVRCVLMTQQCQTWIACSDGSIVVMDSEVCANSPRLCMIDSPSRLCLQQTARTEICKPNQLINERTDIWHDSSYVCSSSRSFMLDNRGIAYLVSR